jgi:uncharacterized protein (DUF58 family)
MKRVLFLTLAAALVMAACNNHKEAEAAFKTLPNGGIVLLDTASLTKIQWIDSTLNLGRITEGEKIEVSFRFKNTGTRPLIIQSVVPSCGCTVAEKPEEAIAPGADGLVKASFNSQGRVGMNHKNLTVTTNTRQGSQNLVFEVEVLPKK